jgi:membrane dipeptidase
MKRRQFIQYASVALSASSLPFVSTVLQASTQKSKRLYVDGLSFVPSDHIDAKASGLDAFIADISAIEEVKRPDGSMNYKRTYNACMKSIREKRQELESHPDTFLVAETGADISKARDNHQCAVFLQIQGADCVEGGLHQVDEFYDLGLRVLQLTIITITFMPVAL